LSAGESQGSGATAAGPGTDRRKVARRANAPTTKKRAVDSTIESEPNTHVSPESIKSSGTALWLLPIVGDVSCSWPTGRGRWVRYKSFGGRESKLVGNERRRRCQARSNYCWLKQRKRLKRDRDPEESLKERGRSGIVTAGRERGRHGRDVDGGGAHCSTSAAVLRSGRIVKTAGGREVERWRERVRRGGVVKERGRSAAVSERYWTHTPRRPALRPGPVQDGRESHGPNDGQARGDSPRCRRG
jgi:hypothetical protein